MVFLFEKLSIINFKTLFYIFQIFNIYLNYDYLIFIVIFLKKNFH